MSPSVASPEKLRLCLHAIEDEVMQDRPSPAVVRSLAGRSLAHLSEVEKAVRIVRQKLGLLRAAVTKAAYTFHEHDHRNGFPYETCPNERCVEVRQLLADVGDG